jgi:hypothetical protein
MMRSITVVKTRGGTNEKNDLYDESINSIFNDDKYIFSIG